LSRSSTGAIGVTDWWQKIFNTELYFELYGRQDIELAKTQIQQVIDLLDLKPPARILDVPCGYGRHSIELAKRGYQVTGVDDSEVQLTRAEQLASEADVAADLRQVDARELMFEGEFDAAINMFLSFGYFETDEEHLAMLKGIARSLKEGGRFLMDYWNREFEIQTFDQWQVERTEDMFEVEEWDFDHLRGRLNWTNHAFLPDGRHESWYQSIRAYTVVEMKELFERAGLELDTVYGNLEGEPYKIDSEAAIFVATKAR
jgi:SAM-dependent methyltransferase